MGTWGAGPYDNDTAADFCGLLNDAEPARRAELVRAALHTAATTDGYLDSYFADRAIAAAAIVAAQRTGVPPQSAYAPDFLVAGGSVDLPADVGPLAVAALDRVVGADSEWRELWSEAADPGEASRTVAELRAVLAA
ncbi:DUF4259 domain-containing protein [Micromonospora cathayae]|uniref:DUF4259 domain-containing protein n=1 Tax=Micromonospora cathayae TaxID=3028804 RepID=A0ABY7ZLH4_9ACTN|nr:DUF4259 domain-containing protein [Micromonospora sp. HUAS 3]WDZ83373.1 DUF4259 domain-containing protein [Micromonospora sp. HUAS 3]